MADGHVRRGRAGAQEREVEQGLVEKVPSILTELRAQTRWMGTRRGGSSVTTAEQARVWGRRWELRELLWLGNWGKGEVWQHG